MGWCIASSGKYPADAFRAWDEDKDGRLSKKEMLQGFNHLFKSQQQSSRSLQQQIDALFKVIDKDGSNDVSLEEFKQVLELDEKEKEAMLPSHAAVGGMSPPGRSRR